MNGRNDGWGGDNLPNATIQRLFQGRPKFANAKVRMEVDMPLRGELMVDVDDLVDLFNQFVSRFSFV